MLTLHTDGTGYWSKEARAVTVTKLELSYVNEDGDFGELRVYFDTATWDVATMGLIYTDALFEDELLAYLKSSLTTTDVNYSEQGMQGDDYVSFDVGEEFIDTWRHIYGDKKEG
jgi:hypothetical protein